MAEKKYEVHIHLEDETEVTVSRDLSPANGEILFGLLTAGVQDVRTDIVEVALWETDERGLVGFGPAAFFDRRKEHGAYLANYRGFGLKLGEKEEKS